MTKISLVKGDSRYQNISDCLELQRDEIAKQIKGKKRIVIKPNFVSTSKQLAATHVDTIRALLDFLGPLTDEKIIIAENAAIGSTMDGFKNYGYLDLRDEYNIELLDIQEGGFVDREIFAKDSSPLKVGISKTLLSSDFLISCAMLKTHDTVMATFCLKNIAVAALQVKSMIHQGYRAVNMSLARLAEIVPPHFCLIDGFMGMEGRGPVNGEPVEMGVALAGFDFLAVDSIGARLMGINPMQIGYLYHCYKKKLGELDLDQIEILGNVSLEEAKRKFKPHPHFQEQLNWQ